MNHWSIALETMIDLINLALAITTLAITHHRHRGE